MSSIVPPVVWTNSSQAQNYTGSRPDYPSDVVEISIQFLREKFDGDLQQALDIGCGTGKSTEHLIPRFSKVFGCDPSQAMLDEATKIYGDKEGNVKFLKANAEDLSIFPSEAFQLIIASRCIHYFDSKLFFAEAERLLVPKGVLVYYTLQFEVLSSTKEPLLTDELTKAYDEYLEEWVGDYWIQPPHLPPGFKFKARNRKTFYTEILQPPNVKEKKITGFTIQRTISLKVLGNLLLSYSASVRFREHNGDEKADALIQKCLLNIKSILGETEDDFDKIFVKVSNEFIMVMTRKAEQ